jgi:formate dehydrogenase maturation protein FdhE
MRIYVSSALDHSWPGETLGARGHNRVNCADEMRFLHCPVCAGSPTLAVVVVTNTAGSFLNYARISALTCSSEARAIFHFLTRALIPKSRIGQIWQVMER